MDRLTDLQTDRQTDIVTYRAAIAAKNLFSLGPAPCDVDICFKISVAYAGLKPQASKLGYICEKTSVARVAGVQPRVILTYV